MAAKLYTMRTALSRVFDEIFQKSFSPHYAHNPKTRHTFVFHRVRQKQGNFKLPPFALKMILNLILKLNLKMILDSKLVLNLILNLILNLKMF